MTQTPSHHTSTGSSTGNVKAGRNIQAENIVAGMQIQGGDTATVQALSAIVQTLQQSGSVEAVQDIIAKNIVTGLQYIGKDGSAPTVEQFQRELAALREPLQQAVQAKEIADPYEAEDAQKAIEQAIEQTQTDKPAAERIATQLDKAATVITKAATAAEAAEKLQAGVIKLAPVITVLQQLVRWLWS